MMNEQVGRMSQRDAVGARQPAAARAEVRAGWLVRARWGAVAAQGIVIAAALLSRLATPIPLALALTAMTVASNAWLAWRLRTRGADSAAWYAGALLLDTTQLTVWLYLTGGPSNPFSVFYLVLITVAAVTVGSRWTWLLALAAVSCYATLFLLHTPLPADMHDHAGQMFSEHLRAMWVALTVAAGLTTYFVTRLSTTIEQRDREIDAVREHSARHERLAALTTLAAGAAHELGTPLATAMVAAGELERALGKLASPEIAAIADDARLIRAELDRSRRILDDMAAQAGDTIGERPVATTAEAIAGDAVSALRADEAARVDVVREGPIPALVAPRRALGGALVNLLRNALQAANPPSRVVLRIAADTAVRLSVLDQGCGMSPEVLARAGEPFFSTRATGQGRGLGLFLARSIVERLGGRMVIESVEGQGTTVHLELPATSTEAS